MPAQEGSDPSVVGGSGLGGARGRGQGKCGWSENGR